MGLLSTVRPRLVGSALLLPVAWTCILPQVGHAQRPVTDPVEELRQVLKLPVGDPTRNPAGLEFRRQSVSERIKQLKTVSDLRRALQLTGGTWRADDEGELAIRNVDLPLRASVAERFRQSLREAMKSGGVAGQLAATELLEAVGATLQDSGDNKGGVTRPLASDVAALLKVNDPRVRATAARALGRINPDPASAAPALGGLLQSEQDVMVRRSAAAGLASLMQTTIELRKNGTTGNFYLFAKPEEVVAAGVAALDAAAPATGDEDPEVRRFAIDAIELTAAALAELILATGDQKTAADMPPVGRAWTPDERKFVEEERQKVVNERNDVMPLANALLAQRRAINRALSDTDPAVRLIAARALEEVAHAHDKLQSREESIPHQNGSRPKIEQPLVKLILANLPAIEPLMDDPDPQIRLTLMNVLFMLGVEAKAAAPILVKALADPSLFVRWSAARVLGRTGPVATDESVPAIAALLRDPDLNVRQAAATTLERYGPAAKAALPQLINAVSTGDAEVRIGAILALAAMGSTARPAVPALIGALSYADDRVQRAAAETLGRGNFGDAARAAIPALRRAMEDEDPEVRKAASEALLGILQNK